MALGQYRIFNLPIKRVRPRPEDVLVQRKTDNIEVPASRETRDGRARGARAGRDQQTVISLTAT